MKSSRVMKVFEEYVRKFDMNNNNVKAKYFHSLKVMEISRNIASSLNIFSEEEIVLCETIGLFHEIGGFDKKLNYKIFDDDDKDYSMKSIEILFDGGLIRKIIKDTKYDEIIKLAIYCHNKNGFPSKIPSKVKEICKVIKDAHKIDMFRMTLNYPYVDFNVNTYPSQLAYNEFKKFKVVSSKVDDNSADSIIVILSNIFNLNYRYSYQYIEDQKYVDKIIDSLKIKDDNIKAFFNQIQHILNILIKRKLS